MDVAFILEKYFKDTKYFLFWQEENRWVKTWVKSESVGESVSEKFRIKRQRGENLPAMLAP